MAFLLDTSTCVFFLRGQLNLNNKIKEIGRENLYVSEITVLELYYGAENSDNPAVSFRAVEDFLGGLTIIPIYSSFRRYAREKVRLRKSGKPMHDEFDLLIGVTAVENQLKLVTDNVKDFVNIEGIEIENWFEKKR